MAYIEHNDNTLPVWSTILHTYDLLFYYEKRKPFKELTSVLIIESLGGYIYKDSGSSFSFAY